MVSDLRRLRELDRERLTVRNRLRLESVALEVVAVVSRLTQVTLSPARMVIWSGLKARPLISLLWSSATAGLDRTIGTRKARATTKAARVRANWQP